MVVWISGVAGKLGSEVVASMRSVGAPFTAVDQAGGAQVQPLDLLDFEATVSSMAGADTVLHLAARPSPEGVDPS